MDKDPVNTENSFPKRFRIWIRMPNWLGDVVMAIPLIRGLRNRHPDAQVTLISKGQFIPLIQRLGIADDIITVPPKGKGYWRFFRAMHPLAPDIHVMFTNSFRGDMEAWLVGSRRRMGIRRKGKPRPLISRKWIFPGELDEAQIHQTRLWERWWRDESLLSSPDLRPLAWGVGKPASPVVGMICGSENSPEKRWPVEHWRKLIQQLIDKVPSAKIRLLGTAKDKEITNAITQGMPEGLVEDWAGKTDLLQFASALAESRVVVCNDTGGMHLANMLGVPVIGIFGPTNPIRTGPIFDASAIILQPEGCPPTGSGPIDKVHPDRVLQACGEWMK